MPSVMAFAFGVSAAHYAVTLERPGRRRDDRALALDASLFEVDHDPIVRFAKLVRASRVRVQHRIMPVGARLVHDR